MIRQIALITGASSGIGKATAEIFATQGINLIICGRRKSRLEDLKMRLENEVEVLTLCFDIRNPQAVKEALDSLPSKWQAIDILINNAGNAFGKAQLHQDDINNWELMLDTNVKGLLYISQPIIQQMVKRKKGHIVNIGSIAGKEVYPNGGVYCASKHAVGAINEAMRLELHSHNIRVSEIKPGLVATEFSEVRFHGDTQKAAKVYQGYTPLQAEDIADLIYFVISRPAHVNLAEVLVLPTDQAASTVVHKSDVTQQLKKERRNLANGF